MSAAGDAAVFARLRTDAQITFYEGQVTPGTMPPDRYAVVHSPLGVDSSDRLGGVSNVNETTYTVISVGSTVEQAKWVGRRVVALLKDHAIPGVGRLTHPVSRDPKLDREVNPPRWYIVDQFDLTHS